MKFKFTQLFPLLISLIFVYAMMAYTFHHDIIFWYLYPFTLLVGIAICQLYANYFDELPTWHYLIFGIGYGTILYGLIKVGHKILPHLDPSFNEELAMFLNTFAPTTILHYILLMFIVVIGEEMFWRGYVQQKLKLYTKPVYAIFITSLLFSISLAISGFAAGALAAFFSGLMLGALYEWKKSLPLIIIAHETFVILLFLVLPL